MIVLVYVQARQIMILIKQWKTLEKKFMVLSFFLGRKYFKSILLFYIRNVWPFSIIKLFRGIGWNLKSKLRAQFAANIVNLCKTYTDLAYLE